MKRLFPLAALSVILFSAAAVTAYIDRKTNEDFIQGMWRLTGEQGGHAWFLEWTFLRGHFELKGYPPLAQEGKYRIIKAEGDKLTLELYDQKGNFGTETSQVEVVLDKKKDRLTIKGQGPFKRAQP
ncbi:MAG TPA: hypothetical protein VJS44_18775 [Pyrinomonadaceae bacterium]|nr:hypothetical protein [Pyrinomonadaceae bacterium]